jgi:hypothetical protein
MQQSAQRASAKTVWVGFPGFRKLKDLLGDIIRHCVDSVLELKRLARHPIGHAHGFHDLRFEAVYQAAGSPQVMHFANTPFAPHSRTLALPRFGCRFATLPTPRMRGLSWAFGCDRAARAEAEAVIRRWNDQLARCRDMLWSPSLRVT